MKIEAKHAKIVGYIPIVLIISTVITSWISFFLFYLIIELFSIIIFSLIALLGLGSWRIAKDPFVYFLGSSHVIVALLNFFHILTYKNMNVFEGITENMPAQYWIAARLYQTISFIIALVLFKDDKKKNKTFAPIILIIHVLTGIAVFLMMVTGSFPNAFVLGEGLTPFKILTGYIVVGLLVACFICLYKKKKRFLRANWLDLVAFVALMAVSEISFIFHEHMFMAVIGLVFKGIYSVFLGRAIIRGGFLSPFDSLVQLHFKQRETLKEEMEKRAKAERIVLDFLELSSGALRHPISNINTSIKTLIDFNDSLEPLEKNNLTRTIRNNITVLNKLIEEFVYIIDLEQGEKAKTGERIYIRKVIKEALSNSNIEAEIEEIYSGLIVKGELQILTNAFSGIFRKAIIFARQRPLLVIIDKEEPDVRVTIETRDTPVEKMANPDSIFETSDEQRHIIELPSGDSIHGFSLPMIKSVFIRLGGNARAIQLNDGNLRFIITVPLENETNSDA